MPGTGRRRRVEQVAGKQEGQRRLARERDERRLTGEAERERRTRRITQWVSGGLVVLALAGVVAFTAVHLSSGKSSASTPPPSPSASVSPSLSPSASPSPASPSPASS